MYSRWRLWIGEIKHVLVDSGKEGRWGKMSVDCLRGDPGPGRVELLSFKSFCMQEIITQITQGNLHSAEQLCRVRLAERPNDGLSRFYLAFVLWRCSRPDEALEQCRETLALSPTDPGLLSDLGNLCRELDAHAEALDAFSPDFLPAVLSGKFEVCKLPEHNALLVMGLRKAGLSA